MRIPAPPGRDPTSEAPTSSDLNPITAKENNIMTDTGAAALREFRTAAEAALNSNDPDKTPEANARARRDALTRAREIFAAQIPAAVEPTGPSRAEILAAHRPATADALAVSAREWEKVRALLGAGRRLDQIIAGASPARLAAILDGLEIMPEVLASSEGDLIVAEFEGLIFGRLASLGDDAATARLTAEQEVAAPNAWSRVMSEALRGEVTTGAYSALYVTDPDACREAQGSDFPGLGDALRRSDQEQERAGGQILV